VYSRAKFFKSDGRIDVVANDGFSGFDIASEKASRGLGNEVFSKFWIALNARLNGFLKSLVRGIVSFLLSQQESKFLTLSFGIQ
jgi:hypothetical protein